MKRTRHDLKCDTAPFWAIIIGSKRFEFRKDDCGYDVGHELRLREWFDGGYTGNCCTVLVTYLLRGPGYGIPEGYVVMSVADIP